MSNSNDSRGDGDHSFGESMPGTTGESEGTIHDSQEGEMPTVDKSEEEEATTKFW